MKHPKQLPAHILGVAGHNNNRCIGPCPYCTGTMIVGNVKRMPTRDHIKPKSRFPASQRTIIVCSECNFMKKDLTLSEFLQSLSTKNNLLQQALDTNEERIRNITYLIRIGIEEE